MKRFQFNYKFIKTIEMEKIIKINLGLDISMQTFWATLTLLNESHEIKHLKSSKKLILLHKIDFGKLNHHKTSFG